MWRERRFSLAPAHRRFVMGCSLAAGAIVSLSLLTYGGPGPWSAFVDNSRVHLATPLKNHVGLPTVLAYDADAVDRRIQEDTAIEPIRIVARRPTRTVRGTGRPSTGRCSPPSPPFSPSPCAASPTGWPPVLGIGLIPVAFELTNYYYAILLGYGLLFVRREVVGAALCGVAALSWAFVERWQWQDEFLTWCSAMVILFVIFCTGLMLREE